MADGATAQGANSPARIEEYALIGDCATSALVSRGGSIDWLCLPRFDGPACLAALLGTPENGRWLIAPSATGTRVRRSYWDESLVLETIFETESGEAALIDFMPIGQRHSSIVRIVEGRRGRVAMTMSLALRFDFGRTMPWVRRLDRGEGIVAIAGPDMVVLRSPVPTEGRDMTTAADFVISEGERLAFVLTHAPSHYKPPPPIDATAVLRETEAFWGRWCNRGTYRGGHYEAAVRRSLMTLKALTFHPTGGIVAAPTTSLPERLGGSRNWDYRYCWLRDATLTLLAFMHSGYYNEAQSWRDWLHRSIAGSAEQTQIMYGLAGERRLDEWEVPWLPGYQGSSPVRVGNAASGQLQLDIFGEVMNALHQSRVGGLLTPATSWDVEVGLIEHLSSIWREPDDGIWETRAGRQQFTFSKIMAWVALDRGIQSAEQFRHEAPLDRWRAVREQIMAAILQHGFNPKLNSFTQTFGGSTLDASLLLAPLFGFLSPDHPKIVGTVAAIERELLVDGFVLRYDTEKSSDGLPPGEGAFLACSFWLAAVYARQGRWEEARALFERLLGLCNDVGLLAEEYDPKERRQLGNFPQALSHIALIGAALELRGDKPTEAPQDGAADQAAKREEEVSQPVPAA